MRESLAEDTRSSADLSARMPDRGFGVKNEGSLPMEQELYGILCSLRLEDSCRDLLILSPLHHQIGGAVSSTLSPKAPFPKSLHACGRSVLLSPVTESSTH